MVDLYNIRWDGKYATADLAEDGSKKIVYTIKVDCETRELLENTHGKMNAYIAHAKKRLCILYEEGKRPKRSHVMWY